MNHIVEESQLLKKAREIASAIIKNNQDMVLRYKSIINDGLKLDLGHALALEKVLILLMQLQDLNNSFVILLLRFNTFCIRFAVEAKFSFQVFVHISKLNYSHFQVYVYIYIYMGCQIGRSYWLY